MEEYVQYCTGGAIVVSHAVLIIPHGRICTLHSIALMVLYTVVVSHVVLIIPLGRICTVLHWWCYAIHCSGKSCCVQYCTGGAIVLSHAVLQISHRRICALVGLL